MEAIVSQWLALHGVDEAPASSELADGHLHRVWRDKAGNDVIEAYSIIGMGHGTPLGTTGDKGYGASGPFMLDVGISSTLRIAQFWGIAGGAAERTTRAEAASSASAVPHPPALRTAVRRLGPKTRRLEDIKVERTPDTAASAKVQRVIEDALRAAGLMK